MEAVTALGRPDVRLTICGSGNPPADLLRMVSEHSWCVLRPGLSDDDLARELAAADLFVLATQTGMVAAALARVSALSCSRHRPRARR